MARLARGCCAEDLARTPPGQIQVGARQRGLAPAPASGGCPRPCPARTEGHCCVKRSRDHSTGESLVRARSVTARHAIWPLSCPCDGCRVNVGRKIYGLLITQPLNATVPDRPYRRYQRTATEITSCGNRKPAKTELVPDAATRPVSRIDQRNSATRDGLLSDRRVDGRRDDQQPRRAEARRRDMRGMNIRQLAGRELTALVPAVLCGQSAGRATLLARAVDAILGTHIRARVSDQISISTVLILRTCLWKLCGGCKNLVLQSGRRMLLRYRMLLPTLCWWSRRVAAAPGSRSN